MWLLAAAAAGRLLGQPSRAETGPVLESVLPALAYGEGCSSAIELQNLSDREAVVEVEGHRESGALVGVAGLAGTAVRLGPRQRANYRLEIAEQTRTAWAKVRERSPPGASPAVAVSGTSECIAGNQVRSVRRDVVIPQTNPWFESDAAAVAGGMVSLINTSAASAVARVCYSSGNLYSMPAYGQRAGEFAPICNLEFTVQIPPFGSREFALERDGSTHFTMHTIGRSIVLEMLRPVDPNVRIYRVDSTIRFEGVTADPGKE